MRSPSTPSMPNWTVERQLRVLRDHLRAAHSASLATPTPEPGHVLLIERPDELDAVLTRGGYSVVAQIGEWSVLSPLRLSERGRLISTDRLVRVPSRVLTADMVVGRDRVIVTD